MIVKLQGIVHSIIFIVALRALKGVGMVHVQFCGIARSCFGCPGRRVSV